MTTFDDRERAEEARFKHDQEFAFKVRNRRNKIFGRWVAEQLGLTGEAADDYAKDVVMADFELPGDDDVFSKVRTDLEAKNISVEDDKLKTKMLDCEQEARSQVMAQ